MESSFHDSKSKIQSLMSSGKIDSENIDFSNKPRISEDSRKSTTKASPIS